MLKEKRMIRKGLISLSTIAMTAATAFAADTPDSFWDIVQPIIDLLNDLLGPILAIVGAAGSLYCVLLGVKYARAEEPQDREKAKAHLKSAIIGFVLIFVLIVVLNMLLPFLTAWAGKQGTSIY